MPATRIMALAMAAALVAGCTAEGESTERGLRSDSVDGALPSGPLTRTAANPLVRNGPESYDYWKTGPRAVFRDGGGTYHMLYEAVGSDGITSVAHAVSRDGASWQKQGVVMQPSLSWERAEVSPNSVLVEDGVLELWYHAGGYPAPDSSGERLGYAVIGYATSLDGGATWNKAPNPVLDRGAPGAFDGGQVAEPRVVRDAQGYRMYYTGVGIASDGTPTSALGMATSIDGLNWTRYPGNPVLNSARWGGGWGGAFFNEGSSWHLWRATTYGGTPGLSYASSADGIAWTDGPSNPVLLPTGNPSDADGVYLGDSVSGFRDDTGYHILYTGFSWNLYGYLGRSEAVCMASIAPVTSTAPPPPPSGPATLGCFIDGGDPFGMTGRDLSGLMTESAAMTIETCIGTCRQAGFAYAGLQYSSQCFCGDSYGSFGAADASDCNMPCAGAASEVCGGPWRNNVYQTN